MRVVGCTGTRQPRPPAQFNALRLVLAELALTGMEEFHHGACKGADAEAVAILTMARQVSGCRDIRIIAHPGVSAKGGENPDLDQRSIEQSDEVLPEQTHFARNRAIVRACDLLVAVPPCRPLPASGGTAYTIDFAWSQGKPVKIVWPDGEVTDIDRPKRK